MPFQLLVIEVIIDFRHEVVAELDVEDTLDFFRVSGLCCLDVSGIGIRDMVARLAERFVEHLESSTSIADDLDASSL